MITLSSIRYFCTLGLLYLSLSLAAQQGNNPFDLQHRKGKVLPGQETPVHVPPTEETTVNPVSTNQSTPPASNAQNPFDIKRIKPGGTSTTASRPGQLDSSETASDPEVTTIRPEVNKTVRPITGSFKFWTITLLLVLLTLSVTLYNSNISKVYRAFLNDNFLKMIHREHGTVLAFPYLVLYALFFISGGIFLFLVANHYQVSLSKTNFTDLLIYIALVMGLFLLKHLVLNIIGYVFPVNKEIKQYSFTIIIFGVVLGLLLIPANVLIAFAPSSMTKMLIYGTFLVIALLYLFRILRGLFIASRYITLHKFHFFMYLCTVEIAPLLVLAKAVLLKTG